MSKSIEKDGVFGKRTVHYDSDGNKTGESTKREGIFGEYTEHTDVAGDKIGESREKQGVFGNYTEHVDGSGRKLGESRERNGVFGHYTEHTDRKGAKVGESHHKEGLLGEYVEHEGRAWPGYVKSYARSRVSSGDSEGWWIGPLIGIMVVIGIVVAVVWLAIFVVLPLALLNSALVFAVLAIFYKNRRTVFAVLSLLGGVYLSVDAFVGLLSAFLVTNVVKDPVWITGLTCVNGLAMGLSTWFLIHPLWIKALQLKQSDRNKGLLSLGGVFCTVITAAVAVPLFYFLLPDTVGVKAQNVLPSGTDPRPGYTQNRPGVRPNINLDTSLANVFDRSYRGTIGSQSFSLSLVRNGNDLTGQASTTKSMDTLKGTIDASGRFEMKGYENGDRFTGIYKGVILSNGSVNGTWTKPNGARETSFSVSQTQ